jgi:hypothetical protein
VTQRLFVGGPLHGKIRDIPSDIVEYKTVAPKPLSAIFSELLEEGTQPLTNPGTETVVYRADSIRLFSRTLVLFVDTRLRSFEVQREVEQLVVSPLVQAVWDV